MKSPHLLAAALLALVATASQDVRAQAGACEQNFTVEGSWGSGRTYSTEVEVAGATYPDALYRVRDKIVEQGLEIIAVQEKNGYIRAANPVKGGEGGTSNAPLRGYVTRAGADSVNVSLQFTIAGGQSASKKTVMKYLCEMVDAAAG